MTAPEIIAWFEDRAGTHEATDAATYAVRQVLELHAPEEWGGKRFCQHCLDTYGGQQDYPCRTVQLVSGSIRRQDPAFPLGGES